MEFVFFFFLTATMIILIQISTIRQHTIYHRNYVLFQKPFEQRRIRNGIDSLIICNVTKIRARAPHQTRIHEVHSESIIEISILVIDEPDRSRDVSQVTGGITNVCVETSSMYLSFVSVRAISK